MIVQIDQKEIDSLISRLETFGKRITTGAILEQLALRIKNTIYLKTQSGRDEDGRPFKGYSPAYKKREGKTIVNLTKTGHLLNSMTQKVLSNNTAKVFFTNYRYPNGLNTAQLAEIHNQKGAGHGRVVRKFFGVSDADITDLVKIYQEEVAKIQKEQKL